jgi:pyoverdine/dityrosine biosynthesis protein Dit1
MRNANTAVALKETFESNTNEVVEIATKLLIDVMQFRRIAGAHPSCSGPSCPECLAPHLAKVIAAVENNQPVTFVLPAFPGKSPNSNKVLGPLPDMAERLALEFLGSLCKRLRRFYAPGARVILCSDGRVFSDVVGMEEEHVTAYQDEVSRLIVELGLSDVISTFNLDDLFGKLSFTEMREQLMGRHAQSLDALQCKVRLGGKPGSDRESDDAQRMYCGITRFLVEDAARPEQTMSKTAIQKDCKARAYEVIRRSNAWSGLVESQFPDAVRLSIHPQACGATKLGIRLLNAESWMTPWHGVAVKVADRFFLLKRSQAEALGATVVQLAGRPSHFELADGISLLGAMGAN